MSNRDNPAFLFVHGAWHGAWTWNKVIPLLAQAGYASIAIDLPRDGLNAKFPAAFHQRPIDPEAYGGEPSPIAASSQDDANAAALAALDQAAALGNGKVVLVGHSLGGTTITHVAEQAPGKLHAVVYLSAVLLPNGVTPGEMLFSEPMSTSLVPSLLLADPEVIGALRIDPLSSDPDYA
ncbi:MAG: alpha/beta fold hydrolase, partial [Alphaproteobacteria bacterium]|nr:alpha/beta fold hydrolase [Alphaproteobacteria bacterium]